MSSLFLRSVTYSSRAILPLTEAAFWQLGLEAARLNALDGITGLLVFNGARFCQTIEGSPEAVEDLIKRLKRDPRHEELEILSDEAVEDRRFRSWDMQLLAVPEDRDKALHLARVRFEKPADLAARQQIYATVAGAFA
jgi:hypothetical protein